MQRAASFAKGGQTPAQGSVCRRTLEKRLAERPQVEARPADEQRQLPARLNLGNLSEGGARPLSGRVIDLGRHEIYQVMRDAAPLFEGHFRRRQLDAAIDLYRIAVDNLAAEAQGERYPQLAFTRSRRSDDYDDGRFLSILGAHALVKRRKMMSIHTSASRSRAPSI